MQADEPLKKLKTVVIESLRKGEYKEVADIIVDTILKPILETLKQLAILQAENSKQIAAIASCQRENAEQIAKLVEWQQQTAGRLDRIEKQQRENAEQIAEISREISSLIGEVRRIDGMVTEFRVGSMIRSWFREQAPEYTVALWEGLGADLVISGRGVLAPVDIAVKPKFEDVEQLKRGIGAVMDAYGRRPDLLVIYSASGEMPPDVVEYARRRGVHVVRGMWRLKQLLDRVAEAKDEAS